MAALLLLGGLGVGVHGALVIRDREYTVPEAGRRNLGSPRVETGDAAVRWGRILVLGSVPAVAWGLLFLVPGLLRFRIPRVGLALLALAGVAGAVVAGWDPSDFGGLLGAAWGIALLLAHLVALAWLSRRNP